MEGKIKIGPAGRTGLVNWDEGSHNNVLTQIFLSHESNGICSIQFQFVLDDDKFILSDRYGQNTGNKFDVIALDWPHEYRTGISGHHSRFGGNIGIIKSLKFATNSNEYGPFGSSTSNADAKFDFKLGKIPQFGGFFGFSNPSRLQSIGVYLQPSTVRPKTKLKTGTSNAEEMTSKIALG